MGESTGEFLRRLKDFAIVTYRHLSCPPSGAFCQMHLFFFQARKPTLHRCIVTQGPSFPIPAIALTAYGPHHAELSEQSPVIRAVTASSLNNFSPQQLEPLAVTKQENLWEISSTKQYCGLAPTLPKPPPMITTRCAFSCIIYYFARCVGKRLNSRGDTKKDTVSLQKISHRFRCCSLPRSVKRRVPQTPKADQWT